MLDRGNGRFDPSPREATARAQTEEGQGRSDLDWPTDGTVVCAAFSTAAFE
jgi:hypothetical protein